MGMGREKKEIKSKLLSCDRKSRPGASSKASKGGMG
jgi:hypothetical protein